MILGIYGSGGQGRETLELARVINETTPTWTEIIFVDDAKEKQGTVLNGQKIVSFEQFCNSHTSDEAQFIIAFGEPRLRAEKYNQIKQAGYSLATLVHPMVRIPETTVLGEGVIINPYDYISCNVYIGNNVLVQGTATIGHDCVIGDSSVISTYAYLGGACKVGARTYISLNVPIYQGTVIGDDAILGMGAVVTQNVEDNTVVVGSPAKKIRDNDNKTVFRYSK